MYQRLKYIFLAGVLASGAPILSGQTSEWNYTSDCILSFHGPLSNPGRMSGNSVRGRFSFAPLARPIGNWTVNIRVSLEFHPQAGGSIIVAQQQATFPQNSTSRTQFDEGSWWPPFNFTEVFAPLDPYGDGRWYSLYEATGICGGQSRTLTWRSSGYTAVSRPSVFVGNPSNNQEHAFWYLDGADSIDGYWVLAQLQVDDKWSDRPSNVPTPIYSWSAPIKPNKLQFLQTGGTPVLVKSLAASDSLWADIGVQVSVDGFKSETFWLHINKLVRLEREDYDPVSVNGGYSRAVKYKLKDMHGWEMIPITIHEEHEMDFFFYSPYSAGNTNWDDAMTEYLEEATWDPLTGWVGQQFTDTMWMRSTDGYSLLPQSLWHFSNTTPVVSKSQKFFAGTSTPPSHMTDNYTGACVQVNRQLFSIERADPVAIKSPVYPSSLCTRGVSVPVQ